jgi:hypothetical protein
MAKDCYGLKECEGQVGPNFVDPSKTEEQKQNKCKPNNLGPGYQALKSSVVTPCAPFQLDKNRDTAFIDGVVNENLNIGGATFNVYKLLGVHEQGKLIDCTGLGTTLTNGDLPSFPASQAFDKFITEWRSIQHGEGVLLSSYLGYDFGSIKTNDKSRDAYGINTSIFKHITALAIKQSDIPTRRVLRARIERSDDGKKWYGVAIVNFPDDNCLNTTLFKSSVPSRYWRIRPLDFSGVNNKDVWGVQALQLFHNYEATNEENIQDKVLLENRDRDYNTESLPLKGTYDLLDITSELTRFGIELPSLSLYMQVTLQSCVNVLGRPLIIGDIIEIPSEAQFSAEMRKVERWVEITDVAWSTEGYTPGWVPLILRIIAQPAFVSQETQDIFGDLAANIVDNEHGLVDSEDGNDLIYQDYFDVGQTITAEAKDAVPERGVETSSVIRVWEPDEIEKAKEGGIVNLETTGQIANHLYHEDAIPPNNAPYTEDNEFPNAPKHGDYHRMSYTGLSTDVPSRLFRYSTQKGRWIFLEKDRRYEMNRPPRVLQEFLTAGVERHDNDNITRNRDRIDKQCEE